MSTHTACTVVWAQMAGVFLSASHGVFSIYFQTNLTIKLPELQLPCVVDTRKSQRQLLTVDLLARASMKNAASCDK